MDERAKGEKRERERERRRSADRQLSMHAQHAQVTETRSSFHLKALGGALAAVYWVSARAWCRRAGIGDKRKAGADGPPRFKTACLVRVKRIYQGHQGK